MTRDGFAWVTGSASGLGRALTTALLARGWRVLATDIDRDRLAAVAVESEWDTARCSLQTLDIRDAGRWRELLSSRPEGWGLPLLLCNVAGYLLPGWVLETADEQVDLHLDINVKGLIHGSRVVGLAMAEAGRGHIINIASLAGVAPVPGIALYSTSKFAVRGFSLALAQELAPAGVSVSVICPDAIETPMLELQESREEAALTFSGGRVLTTDEVVGDILAVIDRPRRERLLPASRGWMAKLASAFPGLAERLAQPLRRRGLKAQRRRRSGAPENRR